MAETKKEVSEVKRRLQKAAEDYAYQTVVGYALSLAIFEDYIEVISKMEGIKAENVNRRIMKIVNEILKNQGWDLYEKQTEDGKTLAIGMIWHDMLIKTAPVPVLKMPMEVENEKTVKKKRKRYL